jgi:flavorubredoxin
MDTRINEIADRIYRLSTLVADIGPTGFTFNQYLIDDDQPLLFHTGPRATFPLVAEAITTITALERLRWITFGHVEADECGSMNRLLAAAPHAQVAHGGLGCTVSLNDLAELNPTTLAVMHGSCFSGDATKTLLALADNYDTRHNEASR